MKEMWNERFGEEEYVYGTEPNSFFREQIDKLNPGSLLLPAEGEGRNAVHAALQGWQVTAIDYSEQARRKAMQLAGTTGVSIDYILADVTDLNNSIQFDAIGLVFIHFFWKERKLFHQGLDKLLKPGGFIIAELFHKEQVNNKSGGPPVVEMLYTVEDLEEDFSTYDFQILEHTTIVLDEGVLHQGPADVVRLMARKKTV